MSYSVLTINPGSTSTKIALFDGERKRFSENVSHDAAELAACGGLTGQLAYRSRMIGEILRAADVSLNDVDAVVGRGGGLLPMAGGTYEIDELLLAHAKSSANGVDHPANLGPQLAHAFAVAGDAKAYVVNPPDVDELQDLARMTGIKGVNRVIHLHALNLKETAMRHARTLGKRYEECNFVVCHIGGGISVSAHRQGLMIDGFDIVGGEGPMAPTRCGSVSLADFIRYSAGKDTKDLMKLCTSTGGVVSHLGISDTKQVFERAQDGDPEARMVWDSMIYQIGKCIGSMAVVLHGKIDGILLGGGMVYNDDLVSKIQAACGWMAPVSAYPGEFEMEAMAAGAIRVLSGQERAKQYRGVPCWQGFDFDKE